MYNIIQLNDKDLSELQSIAKELGIKKTDSLKKEDLVYSGGHDYWRGTGRSIQQISDYASVFFYQYDVHTVQGNHIDITGRSADRKPADRGLQGNRKQPAGIGRGD